jgi:polyisoprenoid-binding protein YceI
LDEASNEQRNGDVKGENFLDVAKYPTMTYQSTGVRSVSGSDFVLDGELTIRGVTRPVELTAEINGFGPDPYGGTRVGFSATAEIGRSDYGINVDIPLPSGGLVISEKIQITIEVEASLAQG